MLKLILAFWLALAVREEGEGCVEGRVGWAKAWRQGSLRNSVQPTFTNTYLGHQVVTGPFPLESSEFKGPRNELTEEKLDQGDLVFELVL